MQMTMYAETAYRPDSLPEQPPTDASVGNKRWRFNWRRGVKLSRGGCNGIPPHDFLQTWAPSFFRVKQHEEAEGIKYAREFWDHERLHMVKMGRLLNFLVVLKGLGWVAVFLMIPISTLVSITAGWQIDDRPYLEAFFESFSFLMLYIVLPPALIGYLPLGVVDLVNKLFGTNYVYRVRSTFELNRRTGQVTLYNRNSKPTFSAPFHEFDAYINATPDRQGFIYHSLCLVHKYQPQAFSVGNLLAPTQHITECYALWDFLQCYMDVTQPLPDIPLLEEFRSQDPTTVAHDKKTGRKPDYWLTMDDKGWKKYLAEMNQKRQAAFG